MKGALRIGILLLLGSLLFTCGYIAGAFKAATSVFDKHSDNEKRVLAQGDVNFLARALERYFEMYGTWPNPSRSTDDLVYTNGVQKLVIDILKGENPNNIAFITGTENRE